MCSTLEETQQCSLEAHCAVHAQHSASECTDIYIMLFQQPKRRQRSHTGIVWSGISPSDNIKKQDEIWKLEALFWQSQSRNKV